MLGCLTGITISTIYTLSFMPKGLYEKGILSETKTVLYKNINRYEILDVKNRKVKKIVFYIKSGKTVNLFVQENEIIELRKILKKHKL